MKMCLKIMLATAVAIVLFACDKTAGEVVEPDGSATFDDYLGSYSFDVTLRDRDTGEISTMTYTDRLVAYDGYEGGKAAIFSNAIDEYERWGSAAYILLLWDEETRTMKYSPFAFEIPYGGVYISFVGCVFPESGEHAGQPGLIPEFEVTFDKATGRLAFPREFDHPDIGSCPAYYATWMFDQATHMPAGCWSNHYMTDIVATKL